MRAGKFEDSDNISEEGGEGGMGLKENGGMEDFYCFKMGKHVDVKEKLRRWQCGGERGYSVAQGHESGRQDTEHN